MVSRFVNLISSRFQSNHQRGYFCLKTIIKSAGRTTTPAPLTATFAPCGYDVYDSKPLSNSYTIAPRRFGGGLRLVFGVALPPTAPPVCFGRGRPLGRGRELRLGLVVGLGLRLRLGNLWCSFRRRLVARHSADDRHRIRGLLRL